MSGICYRYRGGRAIRIDAVADDPAWPLDLDQLLARLPIPDLDALRADLKNLASTGSGFFRRAGSLESMPRLIEISGHRAVAAASGGTSLDLVWVADITEREAAAECPRPRLNVISPCCAKCSTACPCRSGGAMPI